MLVGEVVRGFVCVDGWVGGRMGGFAPTCMSVCVCACMRVLVHAPLRRHWYLAGIECLSRELRIRCRHLLHQVHDFGGALVDPFDQRVVGLSVRSIGFPAGALDVM